MHAKAYACGPEVADRRGLLWPDEPERTMDVLL